MSVTQRLYDMLKESGDLPDYPLFAAQMETALADELADPHNIDYITQQLKKAVVVSVHPSQGILVTVNPVKFRRSLKGVVKVLTTDRVIREGT